MKFKVFHLNDKASWMLSTIFLIIFALLAFVLDKQVLSFSFIFASLSILPLLISHSKNKVDLFRPHIGLSLLLYLYSVSTLLYVYGDKFTYYGEAISDRVIFIYIAACLLSMAGISCGTVFAHSLRSNKQVAVAFTPLIPSRKIIYVLSLVFGFFFFPFIVFMFQPWNATSYADVALSVRVDQINDKSAGVKEILIENIPVMFILAACTCAIFDREMKKFIRMIAFFIVLAYVSTSFLSGWRGQLVFTLLTLLIYYHWKVKPIKFKYMIALALFGYIIINTLSIARVSSNPLEMIDAVFEKFDSDGLFFLAISQSGELATSTNLMRLILGIDFDETQYGYGSIFLNQLIAFIPRSILSDRPPIGSELFVQTFYPGIFESGGGYGFFLPQDGYWDFGLAGVFIYGLFLGMLLERLYIWFIKRRKFDFFVLFYAALYSQLVLAVVRSGIIASFKAALIASIPFIVMWIFHIFIRLGSNLSVFNNSGR